MDLQHEEMQQRTLQFLAPASSIDGHIEHFSAEIFVLSCYYEQKDCL
jgi:hypothetical protein